MTIQRQEIKDRLDSAPHSRTIVDLDEIIEKWVSSILFLLDVMSFIAIESE